MPDDAIAQAWDKIRTGRIVGSRRDRPTQCFFLEASAIASCDIAESLRLTAQEAKALREYLTTDRFIALTWVSTGNYLLGVKNNGTVWKCTAPTADPLVWVAVST